MASNHVAFVTAGGLTNATVAHSLYGYCTTAAETAAKTVTMYSTGSTAGSTWSADDLVHGLTITVRFQYSNTAADPTLNVNGTGAKSIYKYGTTVPGTTAKTSWPAQGIVQLTYDILLNNSGCWVMNDHIDDTDTTYSNATTSTAGLMSAADKTTLDNLSSTVEGLVSTGGETNQNAFSNVKVGNTTITADSKTDTLEFTAGSNITLTPDATNDTITISHSDTSSQASSSNSGRTYIQSVTLDDYGHVTGLSTATESVTNSDTKLQVAAVTSGTTYYPIVGTGTTAATRQYDTTGLVYVGTNGTANDTNGNSLLTLGNSTASTTANWKKGTVRLYGTTAYYTDLVSGAPTANRQITLPDATGTVALTSDIPIVPTNISSFTNDSGYITSSGIPSSYINQNAFSNIKVDNTTVAANSSTDTIEFVAGSNVTLTPDATNDKVTFAVSIAEATSSVAGLMSATDKATLDGLISTGGEVNQNAFSNVKVGSTTIAADSKTDTLELTAGSNVTLTPDTTNDKVTIESTDTKNTAGSTDSSSKLFLIGATSQAANPQTYSQDTAYVDTNGHLYSNSKQVVNLSDTQALTNKTYNGYTLAAASAKAVDTTISSTSSTNLPTTAAVTGYVDTAVDEAIVISSTQPTGTGTKIWIRTVAAIT